MAWPEDKCGWGEISERRFVDGLGTWKCWGRGEISKTEYKLLLKQYIEVHIPSPHRWHVAGVAYARKKLKGLWRY